MRRIKSFILILILLFSFNVKALTEINSAKDLQTILGGSSYASVEGSTVTVLKDTAFKDSEVNINTNLNLMLNGKKIDNSSKKTKIVLKANFTVDGSVANSKFVFPRFFGENGTLTINKGSYSSNTNDFFHITKSGNLVIEDGTFALSSASSLVEVLENTTGNVRIKGGTFTIKSYNIRLFDVTGVGNITIDGGTFKTDGFTDCSNGNVYGMFVYHKNSSGKLLINNGNFNTKSKKYRIILSLGSNEIVLKNGTFNSYSQMFDTLEVDGTDTSSSRYKGKITVSGGTYTSGWEMFEMRGGDLSISGGTFNINYTNTDWKKHPAIVNSLWDNTGSVNITGGTFTAKGSTAHCVRVSGGNKITISGGTFNAESTSVRGVDYCSIRENGKKSKNTSVVIKGGSFNSSKETAVDFYNKDKAYDDLKASISGGTFTGHKQGLYLDYTGGISITGGSFKSSTSATAAIRAKEVSNLDSVYNKSIVKLINTSTNKEDTIKTVTESKIQYAETSNSVKFSYVTYKITLLESTLGTVKVSATSARPGTSITLTIKANSGYKLDHVVVRDTKGNNIEVKNNTFNLPNSNVTVEAVFTIKETQTTTQTTTPTKDPSKDKQTTSKVEDKKIDVKLDSNSNLDHSLTTEDNIEIITNNSTKYLKKITINNELLNVNYYSLDGKTITINSDYLNTLEEGNYPLTIEYSNGILYTEINILRYIIIDEDVEKDNSTLIIISIILLIVFIIIVILIIKIRKNRNNNLNNNNYNNYNNSYINNNYDNDQENNFYNQ